MRLLWSHQRLLLNFLKLEGASRLPEMPTPPKFITFLRFQLQIVKSFLAA